LLDETDMSPRPSVAPESQDEENTMTQQNDIDAPDALLTPSEVAALFRVNPKTVTRWARSGKLTAIRTLGGHRRFKASEIRRCLEEMSHEPGLVDDH
jgi:excisionase family DNA binding protein